LIIFFTFFDNFNRPIYKIVFQVFKRLIFELLSFKENDFKFFVTR
jgi:hypothetical protein